MQRANIFAIQILGSALLLSSASLADEHGAENLNPDEADETLVDEVTVYANRLADTNAAQSITVLSGKALQKQLGDTLGDTIDDMPGVRSASFGPAVGRPIIQGLHGPRVKVLMDGTSTQDLAAVHADHPVTIDAYNIDQIEILKGASALAHGSAAIGGVVNVVTGRLARTQPAEDLSARLIAEGSDNASKRLLSGRIDRNVGSTLYHADLLFRNTDDYEIPGCPESVYQEALEEEEGEEHEEPECGIVESSYSELLNTAIGMTHFGPRGTLSAVFSLNSGEFGIPVAHAHGEEEHHEEEEEEHEEHEDEHGESYLSHTQSRLDLSALVDDPFEGVRGLESRFAISAYEHEEADEGHVENRFLNDEFEVDVTIELDRPHLQVFHVQFQNRNYEVNNEEEPVLPTTGSVFSASFLGERPLGVFQIEGGLGFERAVHDSDEFGERTHTNYLIHGGLLREIQSDWTLGLSLDATGRSPIIEELASRGVHFATNSVQVGNPDLDSEKLLGLGLKLTKSGQHGGAGVNVYHRQFDDFIYLENTGEIDHDLHVFSYRQDEVLLKGYEIFGTLHSNPRPGLEIDYRFALDSVASEIGDTSDPLPSMPAKRVKLGVDTSFSDVAIAVDLSRNFKVSEPARYELPTSAYTDLSLRVEYAFAIDGLDSVAHLAIRNLLDEEQRQHVSLVKDLVPAIGRQVVLGWRIDH